MADQQSVVEIVFNAVDKTSAATQAALSNVSKFSGNVQSATQPIADFTDAAVKFEAGLLAAGLAVTAFSVKVAGDFDTAFREIATLIDAPIEDLGEFRDAILSYASSSTAPLEEITQSIYNAISAGVDYADSIDAVTQAEKLSVAGKATLDESLTVLVSSLNAYGLGMDQAERFSDSLFTTVKQGQTTLPELGASLANVTGLAATAGVDFEELLSAIAALTSAGTPTSQAVTQIQGAIAAIIDPTEKAAAEAKRLEIEFNASRLQAVGLTGVLGDVQRATGGNVEEIARLFGRVDALNGVLTLTGLGADQFADNLRAMGNSAGAVDQAFAIMVKSITLSAQGVQNALTSLFIAIGTPLLDEFGATADAIARIFATLADSARSETGIGQIVDYIESQFGSLQGTLAEVARNLPNALNQADFSGFTDGIDAIVEAVSELFSNIDLSSAEGLAAAITLVGEGFEALSEFTGGVIKSFKPLFDQFTQIGAKVAELGPDFFEAAGEMAGFAKQANVLSGAMVGMLPAIESLIAVIGVGQAAGLVGSFAAAGKALSGGTGLLSLLGSAGLVGAAGLAGAAVGTLANNITEIATGESLSDRLSDWFTSFTDLDDQVSEAVKTVEFAKDAISEPVGNLGITEALQEIEVTAKRWDSSAFIVPIRQLEEDARSASAALDDHAGSMGGVITVYDEATGKVIGYTDGVSEAGDIMNYVYEGTVDAAGAVRDLAAATDELALEEKLALIESQTQITVAQIEASAKTISAAFEASSSAIDVTTNSITDLFGLLGDDNISKFDKLDISKQIKLQDERLARELELKERLTNAQIRLANAQSERLRQGGALITVNGDGLQPHLEAIMFEILEHIQVRVNAQGSELLLGL